MEFATHAYGYFLLVTLTVTWLIGPRRRERNAFLLAASWLFAWKFRPLYLATLIGSSLVNYVLGMALLGDRDPRRRRALLVIGVGANLALLGFFKYAGFFTDSVNDLFEALGLGAHLPLVQVVAPLGISFYTFQAIAWLVDAYRGTAVRPAGPVEFLLFQAFFPRFAAGPICRSSELLAQLNAKPRALTDRDLAHAVALIAGGLFKKMVLGTYLATHMTEDAFQAPGAWSAVELWVALFAYTAQIYLDFSGYTDIARGCALLVGIELPENFKYPYAATDLSAYWRGWHLSLSRFLREYIYFPLGGSRGGTARTVLNLMITFGLCGLWHGASWGYVLWGLLHGAGLSVEKVFRDRRRARGIDPDAPGSPLGSVLGWAGTLGFCALVRIVFKAPDLAHASAFARGLVTVGRPLHAFEPGVVLVTAITIALNFVGAAIFSRTVALHERLTAPSRLLAWTGLALFFLVVRPFDVPFTIYFKF